jgi:spermidine synthase
MNESLKIPLPKIEFGVRQLLLLAFALSGMSVMIYETVWVRPLQLIFGSTVYAVSTMLVAFLTGFSLGSYLFRNIAEKSSNAIKLFAFLEIGIGFYALILLTLFRILPTIYLSLLFVPGFQFIQLVLCYALLIIPATLMGGIWPVVSKAYITEIERLGKDIGGLYSYNSLGSAIGPIVAGFLLIPLAGVTKTALLVASLNLLIGVSILVYMKVRK